MKPSGNSLEIKDNTNTHRHKKSHRHILKPVSVNDPIPVAERSKARDYGRSVAGVRDSNPAGGIDVCVVCVVQEGQKAKIQDNQDIEVG
jgi:hypothetical protein